VTEVSGNGTEPHPGLARRYYGLTAAGRRALTTEAARLKATVATVEKRLGLNRSRS
jgi:DNA-binding PadR family transcriptional regulator